MIFSEDISRLNTLSEKLENLYKPIRQSLYNSPINRNEEKDKLLSFHKEGHPYNPQFQYRDTPIGWDSALLDFCQELKPQNNEWEYVFYQDLLNTLQAMRSLETHDPAYITSHSIDTHGYFSTQILTEAKNIAEEKVYLTENKTITDIEAALQLNSALSKVGLQGWEVAIDEAMNAQMMVRSSEKKIFVRKDSLFSKSSIKRLLVHEIGTHVFRYENGSKQNLSFLRMGFKGYMLSEEGLATYNEALFGVQDILANKRYALRVLAAFAALSMSFYEVFFMLTKYTDENDAFNIVVRAKRGFQDTSQLGSHVKDKVYFEGFHLISKHCQDNPDDYLILMSGKVSIFQLPFLRELKKSGILKEPIYLPHALIDEDDK